MMRRVDAWMAAAAIAAALTAFGARAQTLGAAPNSDFELICASARVIEAGGNPFDPAETTAAGAPAGRLLTHPPLLPRAYAPACGAPRVLVSSIAALALVLIAWRLLGASLLFGVTAVVSGFAAFPWILVSGNPAMLEAIAVGIAAWAIVANKPAAFGLALAPAIYVKSFVPLPFAAAALVRWDARRAAVGIGCLSAGVVLLFGADWIFDRANAVRFWDALINRYGPWGMAELRGGGEYSPSPFAFMPIATDHAGLGRTPGTLVAAVMAIALGFAWLRRARASSGSSDDRTWLAFLAIAVLVVVHPRFKPYSPLVLTPILALALTRLELRARSIAIVVACLAPNLLLLALTLAASGPPLPSPVIFALQYAQWVVTAAVVAVGLKAKGRIV